MNTMPLSEVIVRIGTPAACRSVLSKNIKVWRMTNRARRGADRQSSPLAIRYSARFREPCRQRPGTQFRRVGWCNDGGTDRQADKRRANRTASEGYARLKDKQQLDRGLLDFSAPILVMDPIRGYATATKGSGLALGILPERIITCVLFDLPVDSQADVASNPVLPALPVPCESLEFIRQCRIPRQVQASSA